MQHISTAPSAFYYHTTCFVDRVHLEKSISQNCKPKTQKQLLLCDSTQTPNSGSLLQLQHSFFIFNATVISGVLILPAPLFLSPHACLCVTSGSNLKRLSVLPGYHAEWIKHRKAGNGARAATRVSHTTWHATITTATHCFKSWGEVILPKTDRWRRVSVSETVISAYSSIAETWPNLLAFNRQAESGLWAPEECGRPLTRKYVQYLLEHNNANITLISHQEMCVKNVSCYGYL